MQIRIWLTVTRRRQFVLRRTGLFIAVRTLRVTAHAWPYPESP